MQHGAVKPQLQLSTFFNKAATTQLLRKYRAVQASVRSLSLVLVGPVLQMVALLFPRLKDLLWLPLQETKELLDWDIISHRGFVSLVETLCLLPEQ